MVAANTGPARGKETGPVAPFSGPNVRIDDDTPEAGDSSHMYGSGVLRQLDRPGQRVGHDTAHNRVPFHHTRS